MPDGRVRAFVDIAGLPDLQLGDKDDNLRKVQQFSASFRIPPRGGLRRGCAGLPHFQRPQPLPGFTAISVGGLDHLSEARPDVGKRAGWLIRPSSGAARGRRAMWRAGIGLPATLPGGPPRLAGPGGRY